ncbi:MAG TPA: invasion associated locus B family protein, partial [Beijerinckiaceae bacterium]|nr:invasion associated locus B family protein [Beijerinckiaceae bacterium]
APAAPQGQQPAAPAGPTLVNLKADAAQEWTKVCGEDPAAKKTICYTTRDFLSDNNQPIMAVAVYDVQNDPKKFVRFLLPLSFLLQPGIRFGVDSAQPVSGRFQICFPNGCFAEAEVNEAFLANLKKGTNVKVSVQNDRGQEIAFVVPLAGFGKAFDGAPIDPKVLEQQRKMLEEALQKEAEELRKKQGEAPKQ